MSSEDTLGGKSVFVFSPPESPIGVSSIRVVDVLFVITPKDAGRRRDDPRALPSASRRHLAEGDGRAGTAVSAP